MDPAGFGVKGTDTQRTNRRSILGPLGASGCRAFVDRFQTGRAVDAITGVADRVDGLVQPDAGDSWNDDGEDRVIVKVRQAADGHGVGQLDAGTTEGFFDHLSAVKGLVVRGEGVIELELLPI